MVREIVTLLSVALFSLGCFSGDLNLKIRFDQVNGLKQGGRVLFENNAIGSVTDVFYEKDGTYLVTTMIYRDFKNALTVNSRFFVVSDSADPGARAIEVITVKGDGRPLEDGAVVKGGTRFSALFEKMEGDVSSTMKDLKKEFEKFSEELKGFPQREDMKKLQKDLDQLLDEMKRSGAEFQDKVQKDLVPRLQEEIDKLKERLKELGREKDVEPLEIKMDQIRGI